MNRCAPRPLAVLILLAATIFFSSLPAAAQTGEVQASSIRQFPKAALRGELVVLEAPAISLDGKPDRLSPGARIFDAQNRLVLSNQFLNQTLVVNYLRDNTGQVQQVWVLTREEAREKRRGLLDTLFNFGTRFPAAPTDDGKTPYEQLPAYQQ
jgi:hypothetical protein